MERTVQTCNAAARGEAADNRQHNPSHAGGPVRRAANAVIHCPSKASDCPTSDRYFRAIGKK